MFENPREPLAQPAPTAADSGWAVPGVDRQQAELVPSAVVLALRHAIDRVAADVAPDLPGEQALVDVVAVCRELDRLQAVVLGRLADVEARQLWQLADARSLHGWTREHDLDVDGAVLTAAKRLGAFPLVGGALLDGTLPLAVGRAVQAALVTLRPHVDRPTGLIDGQDGEQVLAGVIGDGVRQLVCQARGFPGGDSDPDLRDLLRQLAGVIGSGGSQLGRLERAFLVLAEHVQEAPRLRDCLETLVDALLPVQLHERAEALHERRSLSLVQDGDGSWRLTGRLDLECGERLHAFLSAEVAHDADPTDTQLAEALRQRGIDPYDEHAELPTRMRPRSRKERLHDALAAGVGRALDAGLAGEHDKVAVHVVVTVGQELLEGRPGALPARGDSGARLPLGLVLRLAFDSRLTRQVLGLAGRVIETSHTERTLKAHDRRALRTQTGATCQRAGCCSSRRRPGAVLHPHHADSWARSGRTSLAGTVLLCAACHADLHHGRVLRLSDGRRLGPDGFADGSEAA